MPTCRFGEGKCVAPLSKVKLKPIDKLILKVFLGTPWFEVATMSKHGIIKRALQWSEAESRCRAYKIPWNSYIVHKLEVCESVILSQQYSNIQMEEASEQMQKRVGNNIYYGS